MSGLEKFYRWATDAGVHYGMWGVRFMLPAIPLLILGFALLALEFRLGGGVALGAASLWAFIFVGLALRDLVRGASGLWRKVGRWAGPICLGSEGSFHLRLLRFWLQHCCGRKSSVVT